MLAWDKNQAGVSATKKDLKHWPQDVEETVYEDIIDPGSEGTAELQPKGPAQPASGGPAESRDHDHDYQKPGAACAEEVVEFEFIDVWNYLVLVRSKLARFCK